MSEGRSLPNWQSLKSTEGEIKNLKAWSKDSWVVISLNKDAKNPNWWKQLAELAKLEKSWAKRDTKILCLSLDSWEATQYAKAQAEKLAGTKINYPIACINERQAWEILWAANWLWDAPASWDKAWQSEWQSRWGQWWKNQEQTGWDWSNWWIADAKWSWRANWTWPSKAKVTPDMWQEWLSATQVAAKATAVV